MKSVVIINEQHRLMEQQEEVIERQLGNDIELLKIPAQGLNRQEIEDLANELNNKAINVIVLSPIPLLLARLAHNQGANDVWILHNDRRDKIEINGQIRMVVAKDGWELIQV